MAWPLRVCIQYAMALACVLVNALAQVFITMHLRQTTRCRGRAVRTRHPTLLKSCCSSHSGVCSILPSTSESMHQQAD